MPEHVNSFASMLLGAAFVSLATVTIAFDGPARADDVCIEQPPHPVAEGMPEGVPYKYAACHSCHAMATTEVLLWNVRYDRARGRKCWLLLDSHGRDVTKAHVRSSAVPEPTTYVPPATFASKIASLFGNFNFMGTPANAVPESNAPLVSPPQISPPNSPRKHEGDTANAKKTDGTVQTAQRSIGKGNEAKRVSHVTIPQGERALFEEFLQWREYEEIFKTR